MLIYVHFTPISCMEQRYRASRMVSDMIFHFEVNPEKCHFRQFCLIVYSFYKIVTFATFQSFVIFQILGFNRAI